MKKLLALTLVSLISTQSFAALMSDTGSKHERRYVEYSSASKKNFPPGYYHPDAKTSSGVLGGIADFVFGMIFALPMAILLGLDDDMENQSPQELERAAMEELINVVGMSPEQAEREIALLKQIKVNTYDSGDISVDINQIKSLGLSEFSLESIQFALSQIEN